ncbi:hypothetical protein V6U78_12095 [Marinospirillum sp. MEB164]|uniref:HDOD domain-containing protein n=1 Tax=Marinospirillum alkalitolerans TaxID=3123374 RepID=A0ABW8PZP9_9GAMM
MAQAEITLRAAHLELTPTLAQQIDLRLVAPSLFIHQSLPIPELQKLISSLLHSLPDLPERLRLTLDERIWRQPCRYLYFAASKDAHSLANQLSIDALAALSWFMQDHLFDLWLEKTMSRRKNQALRDAARLFTCSPEQASAEQLAAGRAAVEAYLRAAATLDLLHPVSPWQPGASCDQLTAQQEIRLTQADYQLCFLSREAGYRLSWITLGLIVHLHCSQQQISGLLKSSLHLMQVFAVQRRHDLSELIELSRQLQQQLLGLSSRAWGRWIDQAAPQALGWLLWLLPNSALLQRCQANLAPDRQADMLHRIEQATHFWSQPDQAPELILAQVEQAMLQLRPTQSSTSTTPL